MRPDFTRRPEICSQISLLRETLSERLRALLGEMNLNTQVKKYIHGQLHNLE